jgi:hypothetical protein
VLIGRALVVLLAAAMGSGCAGVHIVNDSEVAPRQDLQSGGRVRVHLFQPRSKVVGNLVRLTGDTLIILPENDGRQEMALTSTNVRRLELSRGRRSRTGRGVFVGSIVGAIGGYVALLYACKDDCVGAVALYGLIPGGALIGAGIGAGIGSLIRTERWQPVSWR